MICFGRAVVEGLTCFGYLAEGQFSVITDDPFEGEPGEGKSVLLDEVTLLAPFSGNRLINVMGGFMPANTVRPPERAPMWLPKTPNYVTGDGGEIQLPSTLVGPMQIEAELAVVVGKPLRKSSLNEAADAIFGWTVFNDVTAPEYGPSGFWAVGKSIDGFASWGPWIRRDLTEERVMEGLTITATVNGSQVQSGNTQLFCFTPSEILSHISHRISLFPGDVVSLGTPPPAPEVSVGDTVVCSVEEVGALRNFIIADTIEPPRLGVRKSN